MGRSNVLARPTSSFAVNWRTRSPDTDPSAWATVTAVHLAPVIVDSRSAASSWVQRRTTNGPAIRPGCAKTIQPVRVMLQSWQSGMRWDALTSARRGWDWSGTGASSPPALCHRPGCGEPTDTHVCCSAHTQLTTGCIAAHPCNDIVVLCFLRSIRLLATCRCDFDAVWDAEGIDDDALDPLFGPLGMANGRRLQKERFGGEWFPNVVEGGSGALFAEFFQRDRDAMPKGIVRIRVEEWEGRL